MKPRTIAAAALVVAALAFGFGWAAVAEITRLNGVVRVLGRENAELERCNAPLQQAALRAAAQSFRGRAARIEVCPAMPGRRGIMLDRDGRILEP